MARWEQNFDFYVATIDGKPASFVLDLTAGEHAPVATHPLLLEIKVPMLAAREDGLRDNSELEPLGALEDQFVDALEQRLDAIYAGRVVHDGATQLFLYVPAAHRDALDDLPTLTGAPPDGYTPEWAVVDDAEWRQYLDFLAPDAYSIQSMMNRRLLAVFAENGDTLALARPIDHLAHFASKPEAERAGAALRAVGFTTDDVGEPVAPEAAADEADAGPRWALQFHRVDHLAEDRADEFVEEILDVILPLGGDYDGWGAEHADSASLV